MRRARSILKSWELEGRVFEGVRDSEVMVAKRARLEGSAWRSSKAVWRVSDTNGYTSVSDGMFRA